MVVGVTDTGNNHNPPLKVSFNKTTPCTVPQSDNFSSFEAQNVESRRKDDGLHYFTMAFSMRLCCHDEIMCLLRT